MSEEINKERKITRRGLMTTGGLLALAGIGASTGALWTQRKDLGNILPKITGADNTNQLTVRATKSTPYNTNVANPKTNEMHKTNPFVGYRAANNNVTVPVYSDSPGLFWLSDFTFLNTLESDAIAIPKIEINADELFKYIDDPTVRENAIKDTGVNVSLYDSLSHESIIEPNFESGVFKIQNKSPLYLIYNSDLAKKELVDEDPERETYLKTNDIVLKYSALSYNEANGENVDVLDPTGDFRKYSANIHKRSDGTDDLYGAAPLTESINLPKGSNTLTARVIVYSSADYGLKKYMQENITNFENAVKISFEVEQYSRGQ